MLFVIAGAALTLFDLNLPMLNVLETKFQLKILEHFTEFIVIVSLAGAGLAIDRRVGWRTWRHTWALLILVMPLTILAISSLGYFYIGLPLASAFLLAAVLSPTDPVLARSVQVDGPNIGEENDVNVSLTSEAGLNDGLAFPFVYLAFALLSVQSGGESFTKTIIGWLAYDFFYRVFAGVLIGILCGYLDFKIMPKFYSGSDKFARDAGLILLSSTFISYGVTELFSGYGFLAVFITAMTGKVFFDRANRESGKRHAKLPHLFSDQIEKISISPLLLWLGYFFIIQILPNLRSTEILFALALVLLVRPVIGYLVLSLFGGSKIDNFAIAFLGIRGVGSLYYLSYGQSHRDFEQLQPLWRITAMVIILSIIVHGLSSHRIMARIHARSQG